MPHFYIDFISQKSIFNRDHLTEMVLNDEMVLNEGFLLLSSEQTDYKLTSVLLRSLTAPARGLLKRSNTFQIENVSKNE